MPPFRILIYPRLSGSRCSTMKTREVSPGGAATKSGSESPDATRTRVSGVSARAGRAVSIGSAASVATRIWKPRRRRFVMPKMSVTLKSTLVKRMDLDVEYSIRDAGAFYTGSGPGKRMEVFHDPQIEIRRISALFQEAQPQDRQAQEPRNLQVASGCGAPRARRSVLQAPLG